MFWNWTSTALRVDHGSTILVPTIRVKRGADTVVSPPTHKAIKRVCNQRYVFYPPPPHRSGLVFLAGLGSGVTEAVLVVTPAEVCKIRMQAQREPAAVFGGGLGVAAAETTARGVPKCRSVIQTATEVVREEGLGALYKGLTPTVLRQGCNQVGTGKFYGEVILYLPCGGGEMPPVCVSPS